MVSIANDSRSSHRSESLSVEDGKAVLLELLLRYPHLLECGQRGEDGSPDPRRELPLRRCRDADLDVLRGKLPHLVQEAIAELLKHRGATGEHNGREERLPQVQVSAVDGASEQLMDAHVLQADDVGMKKYLRRAEALRTQSDHRSIRQPVLVLGRGLVVLILLLLLWVEGNVTFLLLDLPDHLTLCRSVEHVARAPELEHEVLGDIPARDVGTHDRMRQCKALVHWHRVCDAVAGIEDHSRGAAAGIKRKNSLCRDEERRATECLEEDLCRLFPVFPRVQRGLGEEYRMLLCDDLHLGVDMPPYQFHVVPVVHYPMSHRVLQGQDASQLLGPGADEGIALCGPRHDSRVLWTAHVGGEGTLHRLLPGKARLHDSGAIVDNHRLVRNDLLIVAVYHPPPALLGGSCRVRATRAGCSPAPT
mmetsp:Transcript_88083/g.189064  ORF Transcript_88083/g.189064 Transcript_88083/m.189064 type:complete len:420 (+) Transcript_88083:22-1281(+)